MQVITAVSVGSEHRMLGYEIILTFRSEDASREDKRKGSWFWNDNRKQNSGYLVLMKITLKGLTNNTTVIKGAAEKTGKEVVRMESKHQKLAPDLVRICNMQIKTKLKASNFNWF